MSRTYKDRPRRIAATAWEPVHDPRCCNVAAGSRAAGLPRQRCTLPPEPNKALERHLLQGCGWQVVAASVPGYVARRDWGAVPRWYVRHRYHAAQRTRVRDVLRAAAAQWRGCGSTDLEPEPVQGRGSARYDWY